MIETVATLNAREHAALATLLSRILEAREPPVLRALLFGSKARGDYDRDSDVDLLLLCDVDPDARHDVAATLGREADAVTRETGVIVEPWIVPAADLDVGGRTPMLIDALDDGVPLWPRGAPPIRLDFTPADARFCADCLLDWVEEGGEIVRWALRRRRWAEAAHRARDDITRLATAALLLTGDTRHRRTSSLSRFEQRFVRPRLVTPRVLPALAWAAAAFPPDGGRGDHRPAVTGRAARSAALGYALAQVMEAATVPWILRAHSDA